MSGPDKLFWALCAVCGVVVLAEFGIDRHAHFGFDAIPGFHAAFGFVAYAVLVLTATQLRKLIGRPPDFYEPVDADPIREPEPDPDPGTGTETETETIAVGGDDA